MPTQAERREVEPIAEPAGEFRNGLLGVVIRPVESAVDGTLDTSPDRLEEREGDQRRCGDCQGLALRDIGQERLQAEHPRDEYQARTPVTSAQPIVRLMIRSISNSR